MRGLEPQASLSERSLVRPVRSRWSCAEGANANPHASLDVTPYRETFPTTTDRFERWIVTVYRASRSEHRDAHSLAKTWKILHAPNSHRLLTLDGHFHMFVDD